MTNAQNHSVSQWITDLKSGDGNEAARRLWERYFEHLARIADAWLKAGARGAVDGEDVALSAFDSFYRGTAEGRFPELTNRDELWKLLLTITARKASNQRRREGQLKRGGGRLVAGVDLGCDGEATDAMAQVADAEMGPEFTATIVDEVRRMFEGLTDESLRVVALLRMEGFSNEEIAKALDCSLRSVERKLQSIRSAWEQA
jgi:DNA-directed RNA polymerase specialized sigma24 family protein